jgi:hypothetical protein
MLKYLGLAGLPLLLLASPASALSSKEKMETCKIGAKSQALKGAKRTAFIRKCMGKGNYEPQARKDAMKKGTASNTGQSAMAPAGKKQ